MATLGKALGGYGAFVGGAPELIDWLLQRARTYVYSTALPASAAATAIAAMDAVEGDPARVQRLHAHIALFREACAAAQIEVMASASAIQPLPMGAPERAVAVSVTLLEHGSWCRRSARPPCPRGHRGLRVSLSAAHSPSDIRALVAAIARCLDA
jgi:8-amino-7-oxononanoate synthase